MNLNELKQQLSQQRFVSESNAISQLLETNTFKREQREKAITRASGYVDDIRADAKPGLMELFLAEYGLSTNEGVALMCLAEAYLRTPDTLSLDALIRDKIGTGNWSGHRGTSNSMLVNASTWALMLTGRVFKEKKTDERVLSDIMLDTISRLGESVTQKAIKEAMKILGKQFVLGRDINEAITQSKKGEQTKYRYSFDMLGEAARTSHDAEKYFDAYEKAIIEIANQVSSNSVHDNSGISVKLSALHPRYEYVQRHQVMTSLVDSVKKLAKRACEANIGFTIDAEEADRLELSLEVIEAVLSDAQFEGWDGFGVVVQAYSKQAPLMIQCLRTLATTLGRRITIRLVKGAYWDYEIKQAQLLGLENYPVYTRKVSTDVSYLCCAQLLLNSTDVIYPQFATHNAHTTAAILEMAKPGQLFEFQRLHGMGEALHRILLKDSGVPCRIYAPVGVHKDLLAYLVRRLLENGANSSFVNKLLDENTPVNELITDPIDTLNKLDKVENGLIPLPPKMFGKERLNSAGINLNLPLHACHVDEQMTRFKNHQWKGASTVGGVEIQGATVPVLSPTNRNVHVGEFIEADQQIIDKAFENALASMPAWVEIGVEKRAAVLERIADLYEEHQHELMALATLEAGKSRLDGLLEIREAVDFCRFYAVEARRQLAAEGTQAIGPVVCISPWNFPLAIFTGQVVAALVCGNPVLAKPAEQTTLMATRAVKLMYEAGIPEGVLQLIVGKGKTVGSALTSHESIKGVCFTGSTATAQLIDKTVAKHADPDCRIIAETGGLNTMIVDSTALLEQAVRDIVASAFQSAGQRCSALRILCVQEDIEESLLEMLEGAANELVIGDPWHEATDVGPVIDETAKKTIDDHCNAMTENGRLLFKVKVPDELSDGCFVSPAAYKLESLDELKQEVFGPVLHVYSFKAKDLDQLVQDINASGYGLTMGVYSRVNSRVSRVCNAAHVGNMYVNRNQIGAVVGVQPFGGEGLSGTGPKAGGPHYLRRFYKQESQGVVNQKGPVVEWTETAALKRLRKASNPKETMKKWQDASLRKMVLAELVKRLPGSISHVAKSALAKDETVSFVPKMLTGPTGETNELRIFGRGTVLCLGSESDELALITQVIRSLHLGNLVQVVSEIHRPILNEIMATLKALALDHLITISSVSSAQAVAESEVTLVLFDGSQETKTEFRRLLAARDGARVALESSMAGDEMLTIERVISTDTTAAGGNASLLALGEG
ncbi:bifunctional proline dehydrogenase/L-glutamate gamma-semialdehyde dehydrogenase PutA [Reinekea forsetii]|nr:bifunctional proline dehydrogenase/L-glutamate gamma-semialdehyde dehydrogenase PutA [Reinekea forsetii]